MATATRTDTQQLVGWGLHFTGVGRRGEDSDKFYWVFLFGNTLVKHYGRDGTEGQSHVSRYASPDAAKREALKVVAKKEAQTGYYVSVPPRLTDVPNSVVLEVARLENGAKNALTPAAKRALRDALRNGQDL